MIFYFWKNVVHFEDFILGEILGRYREWLGITDSDTSHFNGFLLLT